MEQAGADALELNIYYIPVDADVTGEQVEQRYVDLVQAVKGTVHIPVAVKLGPHFSSIVNMVRKLDAAGADALVLFNLDPAVSRNAGLWMILVCIRAWL